MIVNRFIEVLGEHIALHDQDIYFPKYKHVPQITITQYNMRIRANDEFMDLPIHLKESLVAHEIRS